MKENTLPKKIYVCWETLEDPWLNASESLEMLAERTPRTVGTYVLQEKKTIRLVVTEAIEEKPA